MDPLEPPYEGICDLIDTGKVIPFLGAGASLSASPTGQWNEQHPTRVPAGGELGEYLAQKVTWPEDEPKSDLSKIAQYYSLVMGRPNLRDRLHGIFSADYAFGALHEFLASTRANILIVTTNYDDLIERAFHAKGRPFDLVIHPTDNPDYAASVIHWQAGAPAPKFVPSKRLRLDLNSTTVIYKMHGAVDRQDRQRDSYVITEDDYIDFIVRMAKQTAVPAIFAEPFRTRHFLFLGYSLHDWNLRVILNKIDKDMPRARGEDIPSWAIQNSPSPLEQELWKRRGVNIYNMVIQDFVQRLNQGRAQEQ